MSRAGCLATTCACHLADAIARSLTPAYMLVQVKKRVDNVVKSALDAKPGGGGESERIHQELARGRVQVSQLYGRCVLSVQYVPG